MGGPDLRMDTDRDLAVFSDSGGGRGSNLKLIHQALLLHLMVSQLIFKACELPNSWRNLTRGIVPEGFPIERQNLEHATYLHSF